MCAEIIAGVNAKSTAAPSACTTLDEIKSITLGESALSREPIVKTATPERNIFLNPNSSPNFPKKSRKQVTIRKYTHTIAEILFGVVWKNVAMDGREMLTILISSPSRK